MAYDSARRLVVLVGKSASGVTETWEWDGTTWTHRTDGGPSPRISHALAFDSARGVTVLFGGHTGSSWLGDTWEWDGATWSQRATTGPSPRNNHAMAYDSTRSRTVLFGGYLGWNHSSEETWEWNGTSWLRRSSSGPVGRAGHAMAYDDTRQRTVLFAGRPSSSMDDTWEWGGAFWTQRDVSGPSAREMHALAHDSARGVTVMFGGNLGYSNYSDATWEWNGSAWTRKNPSFSPPPTRATAMAYDSGRHVTVLFGGFARFPDGRSRLSNETWEYGSPVPLGCCWNCKLNTCAVRVSEAECPAGSAWVQDADCGTPACGTGNCISNPGDDCWTAFAAKCDSSVIMDPASDKSPTGPLNGGASPCASPGTNDSWTTFVATATSVRLRTDLGGSVGTDSEFVVYSVDQGDICNQVGWTEIGCAADDGVEAFLGDVSIGGLVVGDTYLIQMGHWNDAYTGAYSLDIECPAPCAICGDGCISTVGDEECDAGDPGSCLLTCEPDCTCTPVPVPMFPKWTLLGLALMLLVGGAVVFGRRRVRALQT